VASLIVLVSEKLERISEIVYEFGIFKKSTLRYPTMIILLDISLTFSIDQAMFFPECILLGVRRTVYAAQKKNTGRVTDSFSI
jgi:hypothetical protein